MDAQAGTRTVQERIIGKLMYEVGKLPEAASERDWFTAAALAVRDHVVDRWFASTRHTYETGGKRVYYLSLEFLIGRLLTDTIGNLGLLDEVRDALAANGVDLYAVAEQEPDAALGNGGLGRLAACFMDSMATLSIPAYGYGIRYEHGLFRQVIDGGVQRELPDDWLTYGNPWEFQRPEVSYAVGFGGSVEALTDSTGSAHYAWHPAETLYAVAYDTPVVGGGAGHANTLRLWSARAKTPLHLDDFNRGDHVGALSDRVRTEAISRVLYPGDATEAGQELRLRQEFFFASASLQDLLRRHLDQFGTVASLPDKAAIQLNDTHPAIAIAELMRLLVDGHAVDWDEAWRITTNTFSYTNHTLLPEALEHWPVSLMERLLPRHVQIIYLLNGRHLKRIRDEFNASDEMLAAVSMIDERHGRRVRMGHLAYLGSHAVNGVSVLHTDMMRRTVFRDLHTVAGGRIQAKTNGISFRRWLHRANPGLTALIADTIGTRFYHDPAALAALAAHANDPGLQAAFAAQRRARKAALAQTVLDRTGVAVDPSALFDVQVKRIHEYKRQLLNLLHTVALYNAMRARPELHGVPRVKILAGKAAPGYWAAKHIIRLAHDVARVVNSDPAVSERLKVVFLPNYNVSLAELIMPAADLSEQISTAGMEASGTGNMKLALNGALTIGTLDGANVEIRDQVGAANMFIFGMTAEQVLARRQAGLDARDVIGANPDLQEALQSIASGVFSPDDRDRYREVVEAVHHRDVYMHAADFGSYAEAQAAVDIAWRDARRWWGSAICNTASVGWFSSDRTIAEYAADIWHVPTATAQP